MPFFPLEIEDGGAPARPGGGPARPPARPPPGAPGGRPLGADTNRVILLCAILEKKAGLSLYNQDIFVNVAGGIRLDETAADLPLLCAVAGSYRDQVIPSGTAAFGEVGLGGEVRAVHDPRKPRASR